MFNDLVYIILTKKNDFFSKKKVSKVKIYEPNNGYCFVNLL